MAQLFQKLLVICVFFTLMSVSSLAQGRNITIFLASGSQMYGELVAVHDSVITISQRAVDKDEDFAAHPQILKIALLKNIERVRLEEYKVSGFLTGALIGSGVGLIMGLSVREVTYTYPGGRTATYDKTGNAVAGLLGGALAGASIEMFVGRMMSKEPEIVFPSVVDGLMEIRPYARFDSNVPPYVRDIIMERLRETK